jgi:hypothetical protein
VFLLGYHGSVKTKHTTLLLVLILAAAILLPSCLASGGALQASESTEAAIPSTYESYAETPSLPVPWPSPSPPAPGKQQLYVTTQPDAAQVFIDGRFSGVTPMLLPDFAFGHYYLEIVKNGYERLAGWVDYTEDHWAFFYALARETAVLDLRVSPPEAEVRTASRPLRAGKNELPAGTYTVTASAFGYRTETVEVSLRAKETATVELELEKAEFAIAGLFVSRPAFNPLRPGPASSVTLHFSVTAPGSGDLSVIGPDGREIARLDELRFSALEQTVRWNGRTAAGDVPSDGAYTFVVRGKGDDAAQTVEARLDVKLDSSLAVGHGVVWSGSAGLYYAPSPLVLPAWNLELGASALAGFAGQTGISAPAALGARVGLGGGQEVTAGLAARFGEEGAPAAVPSLSYKLQFLATPGPVELAAALQAKAAYRFNENSDFFADAAGFSAGVPFRLALGPFSLYLEPEFIAAPFKVSSAAPGLYAWFYGRAGLAFDADGFTVAASVSARTTPLDEGFAIALPVQTALEIDVYLPASPLYLSAVALAEWDSSGARAWAGFGFGLMW